MDIFQLSLLKKTSLGHKSSAEQNHVVDGLFPCEQTLAAAIFTMEKSSSITLVHPFLCMLNIPCIQYLKRLNLVILRRDALGLKLFCPMQIYT